MNETKIAIRTNGAQASPKKLSFKVSIEVSPLVKFYLEKNFSKSKDKIVCLDRTTTAGRHFYKCIENPCNEQDKRYKPYPCNVIIELSESVMCHRGMVLSPTDTVDFNNFVTKLIYQAVWMYIEARDEEAKGHYSVKKLMDDFCVKFGYDESILSYERLKKARQFTGNSDKGLNIC